MRVGGEGAHLILRRRKDAEVMDAPLFEEGRDRFCSRYLAARLPHGRKGDVLIYRTDRGLNQIAAW
jgi:hypothetical protein